MFGEEGGDDFFVYTETINNPLATMGNALSGYSAGYRGQTYTTPPPAQRTLTLRFDGQIGLLKGWSMR